MRTSTIHSLFDTAARLGARTAFRYDGRATSWQEYAALVRRVARGLIALGVQPGDAVSIVGPNRPEWALANFAAMAAGAVPAPIYPTLTAEQAGYIAAHSEAVIAVVQDAAQLAKLRAQPLPKLRAVVLIEGRADGALSWEELLARGEATDGSAIDERLAKLEPHGLATLIYTSGTTGPPKAVMLSHRNLLFASEAAQRIGQVTPEDRLVSYLPLSHVAEQMISLHGPAHSGAEVWFCDKLEKLPQALLAARPTIFFGVPRVWEKLQAKLEEAFAAAPPLRKKLLGWARRSRGKLANKLVLSKVRARLGLDQARLCVTGAAAMPRATLDFFESLGVEIMDLWGMSESTAMGTANLPGQREPGTIGRPTAGVEIAIAADGEILTRGPHVFLGYYKDEAATRDALDSGGYLHTGDVGELTAAGFVKITDRKKDLIVTSGGKKVSPQNLEGLLGHILGVGHAVVVGDARKHLAALFTLDPDAALRAAKECGARGSSCAELAGEPAFIAHIGRGVDRVNAQLASFESIKKFRILPAPFSIEGGELTPTLKLKRKVVNQRYAEAIDAMFRD
jgi:long-subunit acyl-CoA synthetase (AMP-forming)